MLNEDLGSVRATLKIFSQLIRFFQIYFRETRETSLKWRNIFGCVLAWRTVPNRTVPNRTVPNRTVPNRTVPNRTVPNRTVSISVFFFQIKIN